MKLAQKNAWGMTLVICLTIVVSSVATAAAAKLITGAQIKNNTITGIDIKNGSITPADLAPGTAVSGARGSDGAAGTKGADGTNGSDGTDGATGATGAAGTARAYASVVTGDPPYFTPGKSRGFIGITHPNSGAYCLQLEPGIDADSVAPVATVDYWASPSEVAFVEVHSGGNECEADEIEIITRGSDGTSFADNVGFHVIVP